MNKVTSGEGRYWRASRVGLSGQTVGKGGRGQPSHTNLSSSKRQVVQSIKW